MGLHHMMAAMLLETHRTLTERRHAAEAEAAHPLAEGGRALECSDLDRPDVAGLSENLRGGQRLGRVFGVVVDRAVGDVNLIGHRKTAVRGDQALLQRSATVTALNVDPGS